MSRRKQANPKPLKVVDEPRPELESLQETEDASHDVHIDEEQAELANESYESEEFRPLVIDATAEESGEDLNTSVNSIPGIITEEEEEAASPLAAAAASPLAALPLPSAVSALQMTEMTEDSATSTPVGRSRTNSVSSNSSSVMSSSMVGSDQLPIPHIPKVKHLSPSKTRRKSDKIMPVVGDDGMERYVCPVCAEIFLSNQDLTKHIRSHNAPVVGTGNLSNTCKICAKVLSSQSSLDRHMLVHSGERPFKCKICKMAFTTNGNMHRHSRIHEKELGPAGMAELTKEIAAASRQRNQRKKTPDCPEYEPPRPRSNHNGSSNGKRKPSSESASENSPTAKRYIIGVDGMNGVCDQKNRLPLSPYKGILNVGGSVDRVEGSDQLSCPVCSRTFSCKYGLEAHLDTHPNEPTKCQMCSINFPSPSQLYVHYIITHTSRKQQQAQALAEAQRAINDYYSRTQQIPVGFQDLTFVDFSSDKFSHVAKAWCEENQRRPSSSDHSFTCSKCQHSFPNSGALKLHLETHAPEKAAVCTTCDTNYSSCKDFDNHAMSHFSEKVVNSYVKKEGTEDNDVQDMVSKEEFLLVVGLKLKKEGSVQKPQDKLVMRDGLDLTSKTQKPAPNGIKVTNGKNELSHMRKLMNMAAVAAANKNTESRPMPFLHRMPSTMYQHHTELKIPKPQFPPPPLRYMATSKKDVVKARSDGEEEEEEVTVVEEERSHKGPWKCLFCTQVFKVYNTYQGHLRQHLPSGPPPYKCQLCTYTAGDKSTLMRHLRTHNGERPYQCQLCQFAFTTKANCERHVRKRHALATKDEIERAILMSCHKAVIEDSRRGGVGAVSSTDTICKFCGEDFKQFHHLQHHLRTSAVCRSKVYICQLCRAGYPSKLVCLQHIQKAHPKVEPTRYASIVIVNDAGMKEVSAVTPQIGGGSMWTRPQVSPTLQLSPTLASSIYSHHGATYITTPPTITIPVKAEQEEEDAACQPLDFSMKTGLSPASCSSASATDDQPIDLTIAAPRKPAGLSTATILNQSTQPLEASALLRSHLVSPVPLRPTRPYPLPPVSATGRQGGSTLKLPIIPPANPPSTSPSSPTASPVLGIQRYKPEYQGFYNPALGCLQCPHCSMLFKHGLKLLVHIRSHTNERPYQCSECAAAFTIKTNLERHLAARHAHQLVTSTTHNSPTNTTSTDKPYDVIVIAPEEEEIQEDKQSKTFSQHSSDGELASVNRILDTTSSACFSSYLQDDALKVQQDEDEQMETSVDTSDGGFDSAFSSMKESPQDESQASPKSYNNKRNSYSDSPHKLQCPHCPRAFPWVSSLKRHLLTHTGIKPFKCPACPVTFSTKSNRERHMTRKHGLDIHDPAVQKSLERPYVCDVCSVEAYTSATALLAHYREGHPQEEAPDTLKTQAKMEARPVGVSLSSTSVADDAMSYVSEMSEGKMSSVQDFDDEDEELMQIEKMSFGFKVSTPVAVTPEGSPSNSVSASVSPVQLELSPVASPVAVSYEHESSTSCWKCGMSFPTRRMLLKHLREHNIDNPFKCHQCDASYKTREESLTHTKDVHLSEWEALRDKNRILSIEAYARYQESTVGETIAQILETYGDSAAEPPSEESPGNKEADYLHRKVYCSYCPKRFWSLQDLRRHMRSHTGERPFECPICRRKFTLKHSMMRHLKTHGAAGQAASAGGQSESEEGEEPAQGEGQEKLQENADKKVTKKGAGLDDSGLLHSLLGVEDNELNQMLDRADANSAAKMLGM